MGRRYLIHGYLGFTQQRGGGSRRSGKLRRLLGLGFRFRLPDLNIQVLKQEPGIHECQLDAQVFMQPLLDGV